MKQQKSPHPVPLLPQKSAGQVPGEGENLSNSLSGIILEKLSTLEDLLKKKDDHAYRQTSKPLTFKEACLYLGYAPSYLYKLTYRNIIPHYKPTGKIIFFSKAELDEWVYKSNVNTSTMLSTGLRIENSKLTDEKDPNQIEMKLDNHTEEKKHKHEDEIVIEFPLKSRRKK